MNSTQIKISSSFSLVTTSNWKKDSSKKKPNQLTVIFVSLDKQPSLPTVDVERNPSQRNPNHFNSFVPKISASRRIIHMNATQTVKYVVHSIILPKLDNCICENTYFKMYPYFGFQIEKKIVFSELRKDYASRFF